MTAAWRKSVALIALAGAACASTPQASRERDVEAKQFQADRRSAAVYIYRLGVNIHGESVLYVDQKLIGETVSGGFFVVRLRSGVHTFHGIANDQGQLKLEVRAGEIRFVRLTVRSGQSTFDRVSAETGMREILQCCVLFENWETGQRPLLR